MCDILMRKQCVTFKGQESEALRRIRKFPDSRAKPIATQKVVIIRGTCHLKQLEPQNQNDVATVHNTDVLLLKKM